MSIKIPIACCLLDEIEKAHPDVFNILLQVMDHGKLTDHNGRTTDFRNVVLIMTSNAGASEMSKAAIGFGRERREGEDTQAIERTFTPEFRNRLDAVVSFAPLDRDVICTGGRKICSATRSAADGSQRVTIEITKAAADWLAKRAMIPKWGRVLWAG